ncbi:MAG: peptidase T, partial [Clostridia bacterium]|nr:peptidase T [Clostridia bacterium]
MNLKDRFLRYVSFDTSSDLRTATCPSTAHQLLLGEELVKEMLSMGISDAAMDENGYVTGTIPANTDKKLPVIGFIAHMDVVNDVPSDNIKPRLVEKYDGGDLVLNPELGIVMRPQEYDSLHSV